MVRELIFTDENPCSTMLYFSNSDDPNTVSEDEVELEYFIDSIIEGGKNYTVVEVVSFAGNALPTQRMNMWMKPSLIPFKKSVVHGNVGMIVKMEALLIWRGNAALG